MLALQDVFDEDYVRSDYISKVKLYGEKYSDHFEWVIVTVDNQTREGIRYYFGDRHFDWYIPSFGKGIEAVVIDKKLKQKILSYLSKQNGQASHSTPNCVRRYLRNTLLARAHLVLLDIDSFAQTQASKILKRLKIE